MTEIKQSDFKEILAQYGIETLKSFRPHSVQINRFSYQVETDHALLTMHFADLAQESAVKNEVQVQNYLKELLFPHVLKTYQLKSGGYYFKHKNLVGYLNNSPKADPTPQNISSCDEIGRSLAKLHLKTVDQEVPDFISWSKCRRVNVNTFIGEELCPADFKNAYETVFREKKEQFLSEQLPQAVIHGSLGYQNLLQREGFLVAITHFSQSGIGHCIEDLAMSIALNCQIGENINFDFAKTLLQAYHAKRKLKDIEVADLDKAVKLAFFSLAIENLSSPDYSQFLKIALKLHDEPLIFKELLHAN